MLMLHAIPAWSGFLSIHLISQINGLLKRCYKYGYCLKINTVEEVIESANYKLFRSLQNPQHCIHSILNPTKPLNHDSDPKGTLSDPQLLYRAAQTIFHSPFSVPVLLTLVVLLFLISFMLCLCFCVLLLLYYCI